MKYKNFIIWSITLTISFCFLTFLTDESAAQTRKRTAKKAVSKNKPRVRKSSARQNAIKARRTEAMVIGNSNPVLTNPQTASESKTSTRVPSQVSMGIINGKATSLVKPDYPAAAKVVRAAGTVNVRVNLDEAGNVISARAISGHLLLRAPSEQAALKSKFEQTRLSGQAVKVAGIISYNFVPQ